ncbi:MAG: family 16 glycosylhydrolase [Bacteroidota bacterium]|nr:family 16 glycosylhydrolase [Bacteroidota bacterium]
MKHIIPAYFYHFFFVFLLLIPGLKGWSQVQDVFDDFEGNGDITTWFGDACNMDISFANPNIQGINTSATVLKYEDVGGQYANVRFDVSENFDLSVHHTFTLKIFIASGSITGNQNNQISLKLQDGTLGAPWETQSEIIKNVTLDEWQEISFDFENDPYINFNGGSPAPVLRTDFNRIVLQVNDENNFDFVTAYLDDISYDGSVGSCSPYNNLVWSDEFDGNGPIDNSKWFHQTFIPNGWGWFNGELQHYTDREDNSYVQNGYLHIVAKDETYTDPVQGITKQYTSARLNSKFAFTYGRVEARAKLPEGVGTWPAIWMLGKNINETGAYWQTQGFGTTGWPECGEIDIMEHWGSNQNYIQSALHTPSSFGATVNHGGLMANDVSNTFHIYAMEWTADEIIFSLDGVPYYTYSPSPQNMSTWPFIADQYILLNVAIQNSIEPSFTESEMVLDYIRVYQQGSSSETTDSQNACDSYTWIDGNTYTSSNNTSTYTLTNIEGCDSTILLDLTINNSYSGLDSHTACDSYTWIDGNTYTSNNNTAMVQYTTVGGCDSTLTLDLIINQSSSFSLTETALDSYTLNGVIYDSTGIYTQVLTNSEGCDSTITLDLTIETSVGLNEINEEIFLYPNPTTDKLVVNVPNYLIGSKVFVFDVSGKQVLSYVQSNTKQIIDCAMLPPGKYTLSFQNEDRKESGHFIIE